MNSLQKSKFRILLVCARSSMEGKNAIIQGEEGLIF